MKRTAMDHTKTQRLMRKLSLPRYAVVGILESLWHLAAREAPAGNIGKLSNETIAVWIQWEGDPDQLIGALVNCGWIDTSEDSRLVIHDWEDHCDDTTKKALSRNRAKCLEMSGQDETASDKEPLPEPCLAMPEPSHAMPEEKTIAPPSREVAAAAPPLGLLPCTAAKGSPREWPYTQADVDEWQQAYPAVDVLQKLAEMRQWLKANDLKTYSGTRKFVVRWLGKEQDKYRGGDRGRSGREAGNIQRPSPAVVRTDGTLAALTAARRGAGAIPTARTDHFEVPASGSF